jgi:hypothetical protein
MRIAPAPPRHAGATAPYVFSEDAMGKRSRDQRRSLPVSPTPLRRTGSLALSGRERAKLLMAPLITP